MAGRLVNHESSNSLNSLNSLKSLKSLKSAERPFLSTCRLTDADN
jgi:hypothetical protein